VVDKLDKESRRAGVEQLGSHRKVPRPVTIELSYPMPEG
jgi:hypothetical protein